MTRQEVTVSNGTGLESKKAALFIQNASRFKSSIWIEKGERKANAKSLLGVMSLSIANGTRIILAADGEDEQQALEALAIYLSS
ncbi:MAG TPA: HPr family phosphocarrier protein [Clostridiales bacterium]|nr:HPr family phosphocarrier protein [Clostridiales bacterium]